MTPSDAPLSTQPPPRRWRLPTVAAACGFAAVALFFLLTEHRAHLFGALPWLLLMACPLMHLFHGHGDHAHHGGNPP